MKWDIMLGKKKRDTDSLLCRPVGVIHTPFKELENMPIQPSGAAGIRGTVELFPEFADGLKDLDGFSHLILLYHFHESRGYKLIVTPFLDSEPRGVFATRAPKRPNPIGLSIVRLVQVRGYTLDIENVDILDGTPLLDIKPYVPEFDHQENCRIGWLEKARGEVRNKRSDERFRKD
jgi:tRNA-Thr(GGU) m(6)t(6)A37 methyltransferase TsaA